MKEKEGFIIYKSFYEPIRGLTSAQAGELFFSLFKYQIERIEPAADSDIYMVFLFFKNQFRLDDEKYRRVVERNRSNGNKGGRPIKKTDKTNPNNPVGLTESHQTQINQDKPVGKQEPTKPDKDKDKVLLSFKDNNKYSKDFFKGKNEMPLEKFDQLVVALESDENWLGQMKTEFFMKEATHPEIYYELVTSFDKFVKDNFYSKGLPVMLSDIKHIKNSAKINYERLIKEHKGRQTKGK